MCTINKFLITICYFMCVSTADNTTKDAIGFPEIEENQAAKNKESSDRIQHWNALGPVREPVLSSAKADPVSQDFSAGLRYWINNRQPVFVPAKCPINELYYPGDQKDDWICDCRPAYLYHPGTDMCWPAYRQGPCNGGQHLILPENTAIPICEKNPCSIDSYVTWNGKCEKMSSLAPCIQNLERYRPYVLGVNATTLEVDCVPLDFQSRFPETQVVMTTTGSPCSAGSKRSQGNKCAPV